MCYGTNLAELPVTVVTQLRNPPAEPQAKRTLLRREVIIVITTNELDHHDQLDHTNLLGI
jgi:hypothetical protein